MKTALYIRVSTEEQTTASQEHELRAHCERRGWCACETYSDHLSGAKVTRPGLEALMVAVRAGKVERIVVFKLDRLGRSLPHLALILEELQGNGVALICASQGIDTSHSNPVGRLQLGVLMAVAEFEREMIRERTNAGLAAARARGVKLGRRPNHSWTAEDVNRLKGRGLGVRAISRELKMPASSVSAMLKAGRVSVNSGNREAAERPAEVCAGQALGPAGDMQPATL